MSNFNKGKINDRINDKKIKVDIRVEKTIIILL